jgi:hypothetical protein
MQDRLGEFLTALADNIGADKLVPHKFNSGGAKAVGCCPLAHSMKKGRAETVNLCRFPVRTLDHDNFYVERTPALRTPSLNSLTPGDAQAGVSLVVNLLGARGAQRAIFGRGAARLL